MPNIWMNCEKHRKQIQKIQKPKTYKKKKVQTWEKTTKEQQIKKKNHI